MQLADVPGGDDQAARVGVSPDLFDNLADLVDHFPVGRLPTAPLLTVNRFYEVAKKRPYPFA